MGDEPRKERGVMERITMTDAEKGDTVGDCVYANPKTLAKMEARLSAYEDTGLTPGDVRDMQALCKKNGLAEYVDLIVEAKRQMAKANEHDMERDGELVGLQEDNDAMRLEWQEMSAELAALRVEMEAKETEYRIGVNAGAYVIKQLRAQLDHTRQELEAAVGDIGVIEQDGLCCVCSFMGACADKESCCFKWRGIREEYEDADD